MKTKEVFLKDGTTYFYTTSNYNVENALGVIKATLKQFIVYKTNSTEDVVCHLYLTNEGNWYDLSESNLINTYQKTAIKMAIDKTTNCFIKQQ